MALGSSFAETSIFLSLVSFLALKNKSFSDSWKSFFGFLVHGPNMKMWSFPASGQDFSSNRTFQQSFLTSGALIGAPKASIGAVWAASHHASLFWSMLPHMKIWGFSTSRQDFSSSKPLLHSFWVKKSVDLGHFLLLVTNLWPMKSVKNGFLISHCKQIFSWKIEKMHPVFVDSPLRLPFLPRSWPLVLQRKSKNVSVFFCALYLSHAKVFLVKQMVPLFCAQEGWKSCFIAMLQPSIFDVMLVLLPCFSAGESWGGVLANQPSSNSKQTHSSKGV